MRFSACIEWLFAECGERLADRVAPAAAAGFSAVEFWNWRGRDLAAISAAAQDCGVEIAGICAEPQGQLTDPDAHAAFFPALEASIAAAKSLRAEFVIVQTGQNRPGVPHGEQVDAVVQALAHAARLAEGQPVTLVLEALNTKVDHPGYFLDDTALAADIVRAVGHPKLGLLYDRYHAAVMGEEIGYGLSDALEQVLHVHIADLPGRGEPGSGNIDWSRELRWFADHLPKVRIGCEYQPTRATGQSLSLLAPWLGSEIN
ncbi:MAG: TIM barrel protein [Propionibacteriaceae bacterium]|jgi:hydroxypyruvate isomerase|nr:TIM barrel protein [Propionibacteriaceae bacterium]